MLVLGQDEMVDDLNPLRQPPAPDVLWNGILDGRYSHTVGMVVGKEYRQRTDIGCLTQHRADGHPRLICASEAVNTMRKEDAILSEIEGLENLDRFMGQVTSEDANGIGDVATWTRGIGHVWPVCTRSANARTGT